MLLQVSDGILVIENDQISQICSKLLNIKRPSFRNLNEVIATNLVSLLLPSSIDSPSGTRLNVMGEPLRHLCCHPVILSICCNKTICYLSKFRVFIVVGLQASHNEDYPAGSKLCTCISSDAINHTQFLNIAPDTNCVKAI